MHKRLLKKTRSLPVKSHHLRHPFAVPVITFLVFFVAAIVIFISQSGQTVGASDSRLVNLAIDGNVRVIPTTAPTVGVLLNRLNIKLNKGDVVEPSLTTPILENGFQINIYRMHPVTVIENNQKTVVLTANNDPRAIAEQAGYTLYPQDYVNVVKNADNLSQNVIGEEINVDPATPVTLSLYGNQVTVRTHATTVGQLLSEKGIKTSSGNNVLPALSTPITAGLPILVVPVGQQLSSTQQSLPFPVENVSDASIPYGTVQIQQQGINGLALVVQDKSGANATTLQQVVISQPVPEIVDHGTGITVIAGGNNISWLKSSDINVSDYNYVNAVVDHESGWNPDDISGSGCIGLGQSCGSPPGLAVVCPDWQDDAVCQLDFFNSYAESRYGGWAGAATHEDDYGWW